MLSAPFIKANNIQLANVLLNGQNTGSQYSIINFDVSWENSWRTITNETNYDGAWIFVKFRKKAAFGQEIPDWIKQIVTVASNNSTYRLQSNRVYLTTATGFEVSALLDEILKLSDEVIQKITNTKDLAMLFISLTQEELKMDISLNSSPLRGA